MARTYYIPEREKLEPRYGKGTTDFNRFTPHDARDTDKTGYWEFQSVENFLSFLDEEDRTDFTTDDLIVLAQVTGKGNHQLRLELESHGLSFQPRCPERKIATFGTNQHDRWTNSEARRMGSSGTSNTIIGMAD